MGDGELVFATNRHSVAMVRVSDGVILWEAAAGQGDVLGVASHLASRSVGEAGRGGVVVVRDADTGEVKHQLDHPGGFILALAFHPDGRLLAAGDQKGSVSLWNLERGSLLARLRVHDDYIRELAFAPDGSFLVSASGDGTLFIHDTLSPAERAKMVSADGDGQDH